MKLTYTVPRCQDTWCHIVEAKRSNCIKNLDYDHEKTRIGFIVGIKCNKVTI